jgi:hypothetical protein
VSQTQHVRSSLKPSFPGDSAALTSIVYRSRAVAPLSDYDLYTLVQSAQAHNEAENITGLLLYDSGKFYQWVEGPPAAVAQLMKFIHSDNRHTDLEILSDKVIGTRQFPGWSMRLASRGVRSIHSVHNVVVPSTGTLAGLAGAAPEQVAVVLAGFAAPQPEAPQKTNNPLQGPPSRNLRDVIVNTVLPEIVTKFTGQTQRAWPIDARALALAEFLTAADESAALTFLRTLADGEGSIRHLYQTVVEPAARALGNFWAADLCSEFDVTVGLATLQRTIRIIHEEAPVPLVGGVMLPAVLIVPEPGEAHVLNAVLDADALWNSGWDPAAEFPASDEALQDMVAGSWFDALDLSLSAAFRREGSLAKVQTTITAARHASKNKALVVVVGGRIFSEDAARATQVGADGVTTTAMQTGRAIREGLARNK